MPGPAHVQAFFVVRQAWRVACKRNQLGCGFVWVRHLLSTDKNASFVVGQ